VWVKEFSLRPVSEKPKYKIYWIIAVSLWVFVVCWIVIDYFKNYGFSLKQAPATILIGGVAVGILMPHHTIMQLNDFLLPFFSWTPEAGSLADWTEISAMYSIWHFLAFVSLTLVVCRSVVSLKCLAQNFGLLIIFAMVTEVLQLLAVNRKSELVDFFTDVAGIVAALVLLGSWRVTQRALGRMMLFINTRHA